MPIAVSSVEGRARPRVLESGGPGKWFSYVRSDYITSATDRPGPQGFLVEMDRPGVVIPPHFHRVEEFQVVVGGGGTLGKHPIRAVTAHFADAYTPYGPIVVGPEGLAFFTLRRLFDAGANYMPESRAQMIRKARRNVAGKSRLERPESLARLPAPVAETLLEPQADGVGAMLLRLGPGATASGPALGAGGGQYALVASGTARLAGATLPRWSCIWVGPDEPALALESGEDGAEIVIVQFPRGG